VHKVNNYITLQTMLYM